MYVIIWGLAVIVKGSHSHYCPVDAAISVWSCFEEIDLSICKQCIPSSWKVQHVVSLLPCYYLGTAGGKGLL